MFITAVKVMGDSGKEYTVNVLNSEARCNCPSFVFNKKACKHIVFAANALKRT